MSRGGLLGGAVFLVIALLWAVLDPLLALKETASLGQPGGDWLRLEATLLARGRAALLPLRRGLDSADQEQRLRCAYLLALLGDARGDEALLEALHGGETPTLVPAPAGRATALAQHLLLSLWDRRRGPARARAVGLLGEGPLEVTAEARRERELDLLLALHPGWAGGYVARARLHLRQEEPGPAVRDALCALLLEPNDFEAMVVLGRAYRRLDRADHAVDCLRRAVEVCPRLEKELAEELEALRVEAQAEREKRLKDRRLELPLL